MDFSSKSNLQCIENRRLSNIDEWLPHVNIEGSHSILSDANLGVPQGRILGPVLFLIFMNDLPKILEHSAADIYADDTTISANAY